MAIFEVECCGNLKYRATGLDASLSSLLLNIAEVLAKEVDFMSMVNISFVRQKN